MQNHVHPYLLLVLPIVSLACGAAPGVDPNSPNGGEEEQSVATNNGASSSDENTEVVQVENGSCSSNSECATVEFCRLSEGCGPTGGCEEKPAICAAGGERVCGCDGETYLNTCEASSAGVSVDYEGYCPGDDPIEICAGLVEKFLNETSKIRSCTKDNQCGQVLEGSSCGQNRDWVARLDADTQRWHSFRNQAIEIGCALPGVISTCDNPPALGFECDDGTCNWDYL